MTNFSIMKRLFRIDSKRHSWQGNTLQILAWPMVCLAAVALLWGAVLLTMDAEKKFLKKNALDDVAALSKAAAKGLSLSLEQVDQVTQSIQYQWEHGQETGNLNELVQNGIILRHWVTVIGILDRDGNAVRATQPVDNAPKFTDDNFFRFHRTHPTRALHIEPQTTGRITGRPVIQFTRRLEAADGSFNGVVVLCVPPSYLTDFYDANSVGKRGYLGVHGTDGALYAATVGGVAETKPMLRSVPADSAGIRVLKDPQWLGDSETRLVAWQALTPYPLFVTIGLSEEEVLAPYRMLATNYINSALAATLFLVLSALTGTLVSIRLVRRRQQAQEIKDAYRLATEGANEGFYILQALYDAAGYIVDFLIADCNERGAVLGGCTRDQLIGLKFSSLPRITDIFLPKELSKEIEICRKAMVDGRYEDDFEAAPNSSFRGFWLHRRMVRLGDGLAITVSDISAAKRHEQHLLSMANEDTLTKLPNRHWLMDFLPEALEKAKINQSTLALLFIDIDNLKQVNDTFGHAAGDALLRIAALRLKSELRPDDSLARLGGDEFTIVLENVDAMDAGLVAARIVATFKDPIELDAGKALVGTSIGISLFPCDGADVDTLFKHADIAMYAAKTGGKGKYCFYEAGQDETLMGKRTDEV